MDLRGKGFLTIVLFMILTLSTSMAQINTPEVDIYDPSINSATIIAMGMELELVILTQEQWVEVFTPDGKDGKNYLWAGGMTSENGKTIFLRQAEIWLLGHEVAHAWQHANGHLEMWEAIEPRCLPPEATELFTPDHIKGRGLGFEYICNKAEIWARYLGEVLWPRYCFGGDYHTQAFSLKPFGIEDHADCLLELDYANHPYQDALSYYLK